MCFPVPWQQPAVVAVVWDRDCTFCGLGGGSKQQKQPRADLVALRLKNVSPKLCFSEVWRQAEEGVKLAWRLVGQRRGRIGRPNVAAVLR